MTALPTCLQRALENLYRIDGLADVTDFRVSREVLRSALGSDASDHRESLLVQESGNETYVALFLCEEVEQQALRFLQVRCPRGLDAFCVALEGVSHFVYLTYAGARQERPVSQVELELQAEIDKFLVLRAVLGLCGTTLRDRLFGGFELRPGISTVDRARYRFANRYGRRYAKWLDQRFSSGRGSEALADARITYRRPLEHKLSRIARPT